MINRRHISVLLAADAYRSACHAYADANREYGALVRETRPECHADLSDLPHLRAPREAIRAAWKIVELARDNLLAEAAMSDPAEAP